MAHNLNIENGVAAMAYNVQNGTPWHGLGTPIEGAMTSEEALKAAHLDFVIGKTPLHTTVENPSTHDKTIVKVTGNNAIVRFDTNTVLGIVGDRYTPVQNVEAFNFFDAITGNKEAMFDTAGALGNGEKIWIMAKLPKDIIVNDVDIIQNYLLLYNSHDGTSSIRCRFTPVRVVCNNTLNAAMSGKGLKEISIRHTKNVQVHLETAHKLMGIVARQIEETQMTFDHLARHEVSTETVKTYLEELYPDKNEETTTRTANIRQEIFNLFTAGKGNGGKSAWDLYNGTTEYVDHYRSVHGIGDDSDANKSLRWEANTFGSGLAIKEKALDLVMAMAN